MVTKRSMRRVVAGFLCLLMVMSFSGSWIGFVVHAADTLSITGTFTFAGGEPIRHAYVEAYDSDYPGPFGTCPGPMDDYLGYSYTGEDGSYTIDKRDNGDPIDNDDGWLQDGRDIFVVCYAGNWRVEVCGNPGWMSWLLFEGGPYRFRTTVKDDVEAGTVNMGSKDAPSDQDEAFNVFDTINRGYETMLRWGLPSAPHVTAFWDDYFTPEASYYFPSSIAQGGALPEEFDWWLRNPIEAWRTGSGLSFEAVVSTLEGVHLRNGDGWKEHVVLHEYGHFIMDKFADFWPPITSLQHTHTENYYPQHAWGEGWAHFFSAAVRHFCGYPAWGANGYRQEPFDIESNGYKGDSNEAAVAGILWDIYDAEYDEDEAPGDILHMQSYVGVPGPIWDVLVNYDPNPGSSEHNHPWDIYEFWDGFLSRHGGEPGVTYDPLPFLGGGGLWRIFDLHGIRIPDYQPPANPETVTIWPPHFVGVWVDDNTIELRLRDASDDLSGVQGIAVVWDNSPDTLPTGPATESTWIWDTTTSAWTWHGGSGGIGDLVSPPLSTGNNWYLHVRTVDWAGNWAPDAVNVGPFWIGYPISISIAPSTATLQPTLGSSAAYTISIKNNNYYSGDTFDLAVTGNFNFIHETEFTIDPGQTHTTTLTVTPKGGPIALGEWAFLVKASAHTITAYEALEYGKVNMDFTPTLPATPTGGLAVEVIPKTIITQTGTLFIGNITLINNQNFDDVVTVDISNVGIPAQYQASLDWFFLVRRPLRVYMPAGSKITNVPIFLLLVPEGTPSGLYMFKMLAASTANPATTAEDIGKIIVDDNTPPITIITSTGTFGLNGWYVSDVKVTFTATDDLSGVASTEYSFDGANWIPYTGEITINSEGTTIVYYRSLDNAGNIEPTNTATLILDKTAPTIIINQPISGNYYDFETITIDFTATDTTSHVATTTAQLDSTTVSNGQTIELATFSLGTHTLTVTATDNAGNTATDTVTITVRSSNPEVPTQELIKTIETWELPKGTEISLTAKLKDAIHLLDIGNEIGATHKLTDFMSQVEALRGSKLTNAQADYLISEAQRIIYLIER